MRLPAPALIDNLVELAARDDPDLLTQAAELCRAFPVPVRTLVAARLADQAAFRAAIRCAWPDDEAAREHLTRAVIRDCAEHVLPAWQELLPGDETLKQAIALSDSRQTAVRSTWRALERAARRSPHLGAYAMASIGVSLLVPQTDDALRTCAESLPLVINPDGALPWMASRLLRHLAGQRPLSTAHRRALAACFAVALDEDDFPRAGLLLSGGCAYDLRGQTLRGAEKILASYEENSVSAGQRFDAVAYSSAIGEVDEECATIQFEDHLTLVGARHTFRCHQRLWFDELGRIWRIEHRDLPGEQGLLAQFLQALPGGS